MSELKQIQEKLATIRREEISPSASRQHLDKVLAWYIQAKEQKINWRKLEQQFLCESNIQLKKEKLLFKDGSKFLRHWQGKTYTVITQGNQFLYEDKTYKSLSKIAREITGTNWNGKLFFKIRGVICKKKDR